MRLHFERALLIKRRSSKIAPRYFYIDFLTFDGQTEEGFSGSHCLEGISELDFRGMSLRDTGAQDIASKYERMAERIVTAFLIPSAAVSLSITSIMS
jgi:hypothetical protein